MSDWKFAQPAARFHSAIDEMLALDPSPKDLIHNNPVWAGGATIARWLFFYEVYKMTAHLAGHYAEVGVDKGASLLYFAKLFELIEPHSLAECHGFDWFQGMRPGVRDIGVRSGSYLSDYDTLIRQIEVQGLGHVAKVHRMDATQDLAPWFADNPTPLRIAFLDAGVESVLGACIPVLWANLVPGGVLILDHFGDPRVAPEATAVRQHLPGVPVRQFPWSRHPAAYVVK